MWEDKGAQIFLNLPKHIHSTIYFKSNMFQKSPNSHRIFGLLLQDNLLFNNFKNGLIWSHCLRTTFREFFFSKKGSLNDLEVKWRQGCSLSRTSSLLPVAVAAADTFKGLFCKKIASASLKVRGGRHCCSRTNNDCTVFLKNGPVPASFCLFLSFPHDTNQYNLIKA